MEHLRVEDRLIQSGIETNYKVGRQRSLRDMEIVNQSSPRILNKEYNEQVA